MKVIVKIATSLTIRNCRLIVLKLLKPVGRLMTDISLESFTRDGEDIYDLEIV